MGPRHIVDEDPKTADSPDGNSWGDWASSKRPDSQRRPGGSWAWVRDSGQRCWAVPPGLRAGETGLGCLPTHCAAWGRPFPFLGPVQPHGQLRIQMLGLVGNNGALEGPPSILCLVVRGGPGSGPRLCWVDTLGGQCLTSWQVEGLRRTCIFWLEKGRLLSREPGTGCPLGQSSVTLPFRPRSRAGLASPEIWP